LAKHKWIAACVARQDARMWARFGQTAAEAYDIWAFFLLGGCFGLHLLLVGLYLHATWKPKLSRWYLFVEVTYGLINPVAYLLVFQPALFRPWTPAWLSFLCWLLWATYWGARFFGAGWMVGASAQRKWARQLLRLVAALISGLLLRDVVAALTGAITITATGGPGVLVSGVFCLPLYALPLVVALRQLSATRSDAAWSASSFFVGPRVPRWGTIVLVGGLSFCIAGTLPRVSEDEARALLVQNQDTIVSVSRERNLDPRVLASIVYVTQRELTSPFRSALEESVAEAWLTDSTSHTLLAEGLDPSLGIAQVKAHTVLTAYAIHELSAPCAPKFLSKEYRSVRTLSRDALERIPTPALLRVGKSARDRLPSKREVVEGLRTPAGNLAYAAFVLDLCATQWETTNPDWSIRSRPDILATLFQLGFERSVPNADPRSNDFGDRVREAFNEPWMVAQFEPPAAK
jgi:hypothetical protein